MQDRFLGAHFLFLSFLGLCATQHGLVLPCMAVDAATIENTEDWIRGTGEQLELRVQGHVMLSSGQPAERPSVSVTLETPSMETLPVVLVGNRFTTWVPVGRLDWYSVRIGALSMDSMERYGQTITPIDLRQIAIDGLEINLQRANRTVSFSVLHDENLVPDAHVSVEVSDGPRLQGKSSADGVFSVDLLAQEQIRGVTAWTDDHRYGGYQFDRSPRRDLKAPEHTVELASCREQTFRVIDSDQNPVSDLTMNLMIATPAPDYNFLGTFADSQITTNVNGKAKFKWFPDWKDVHCHLELQSDRWVKDGKLQYVDGDCVVTVKPKKQRRKLTGLLKRAGGSKAGFHIQVRSFQGEEKGNGDFTYAASDPDGSFTAMVLPDATYCVCVNDTEYLSEIRDLIPWPSDQAEKPIVNLTLQRGVPVTAKLTAGPSNRPIENQTLHLRQEHHFTWIEDGKERSGGGSRGKWVTTNHEGIAVFKSQAGTKQTVSIYNPDWRVSETIDVIHGGDNFVEIHREFETPRTVLGIVLSPNNEPVEASNLQVTIGAIDGNTRFTEAVQVRPDGVFSIETMAAQIGVLVTTKDGLYSGVMVEKRRQRLLRVPLTPTRELRGRLCDKNGKPIVDRQVVCNARVDRGSKRRADDEFASFFQTNRRVTKTNSDGYYVFEHMPCGVDLAIQADSTKEVQDHWLGLVKLTVDDEPAIKIDTLDD